MAKVFTETRSPVTGWLKPQECDDKEIESNAKIPTMRNSFKAQHVQIITAWIFFSVSVELVRKHNTALW